MPESLTDDSKNAAGQPVADPHVTTPGATHASVDGEASPRLPHEHDESSDSGSRPPDPVIEQAARDAESPKQETDRGEATDALYQRHLRGAAGDSK